MASENDSQVIFDQKDDEENIIESSLSDEVEEVEGNNKDDEDQRMKRKLEEHWLFKTHQHDFIHPRENNQRRKISPEYLEEQVNKYVRDLQAYQKQLSPSDSGVMIHEEIELSTENEAEFLFRNDTMRFHKAFNFQNLTKQKPLTSRNTSNFISTSYNPLSRFPRKAKEKLNYVFHNDDSNDEFINIDVTINKGKQQTNTTDNKDKKAERKAIFIEPLPKKKGTQKRSKNRVEKSVETVIDNESQRTEPPRKRIKGTVLQDKKEKLKSYMANFFGPRSTTPNGNEPSENCLESKGASSDVADEVEEKRKEKFPCPMCFLEFPENEIQHHASNCNGLPRQTRKQAASKTSSLPERADINENFWKEACQGLDSTSSHSNVNNDTNIEKVDNPWKDTTENDNHSRNPRRAKNEPVNMKKLIENKTKQADDPKNFAEKKVVVHEININDFITDDESEENPIKFAEVKKKLRTKKNNRKQSRTRQIHLSDENDESIGEDLLKQYLPQVTSTLKNVKLSSKRAYTTQNFGHHEDSQNNGDYDHEKCFRCSGMFIKGKPYTEHVNECLDCTSRDVTLETVSS